MHCQCCFPTENLLIAYKHQIVDETHETVTCLNIFRRWCPLKKDSFPVVCRTIDIKKIKIIMGKMRSLIGLGSSLLCLGRVLLKLHERIKICGSIIWALRIALGLVSVFCIGQMPSKLGKYLLSKVRTLLKFLMNLPCLLIFNPNCVLGYTLRL